jgi:hypothetical protein
MNYNICPDCEGDYAGDRGVCPSCRLQGKLIDPKDCDHPLIRNHFCTRCGVHFEIIRRGELMAFVSIESDKLATARRYANLISNKRQRDFANAYINWMINGAEGLKPDTGRLPARLTAKIQQDISDMNLWDRAN